MEKGNYYLYKNQQSGEIIYLEYDKIAGYPITPKTNIADAISVNKIILVNPSLSEKLIRKKVDIKLKQLLKELEEIEETGGTEDGIKETLMKAERLRVNIINKYMKYLGNTYGSLTVRKIQIIINQLRIKLYNKINQRNMFERMNELYYLDDEEPKKGRGR